MHTHNPIEQSLSTKLLILSRHFSLTLYWADHQPQCVRNDESHHTCIQTQTCNLGIREGAINHTTDPCTFSSESFYALFCLSIRKGFLLQDCYFYKAFTVSLCRCSKKNRRGLLCFLPTTRPMVETGRVSFRTLSCRSFSSDMEMQHGKAAARHSSVSQPISLCSL